MSEAAGPDRTAILEALDRVVDPKSGRGLTSAGLVRGLVLRGDRAAFMLEAAPADIQLYAPVRDAAERALAAVPGVATAQVVLTSEAPAAPRVGRRYRSGSRKAPILRQSAPASED